MGVGPADPLPGLPSGFKTLSLTHVIYEDGNLLSKALAIVTLTPVFAPLCLVAAFVATRRLEWLSICTGALAIDLVCLVLKEIIAQPRPPGSYRPGFGMPSEHAAFAVFCSLHLSLCISQRLSCPALMKAVAWALLALWSVLVLLSRAHAGVHSVSQLLVGAAIGGLGGVVWFYTEALAASPLRRLQGCLDALWAGLEVKYAVYSDDAQEKPKKK
eukprot:TRINITY_DN124266_c0_g1_i1.p1 TRINITY_DN124266_c0_g1~~TRINITY_DN124266_c0_g1_i1.p1  ORF type:complete len:245 (-),score=40.94 TRINITY_DN124266_c0_g1_i1:195-839(-)